MQHPRLLGATVRSDDDEVFIAHDRAMHRE
jgi:hypothetical protein